MFSFLILIIELCVLAFLNVVGITQRPDAVMYIFIAVFTAVYASEVLKNKKLNGVKGALLSGYFFRLAILFWDIYEPFGYSVPHSGDKDAHGFYVSSLLYAEGRPREYGGYFTKLTGWSFKTFGVSKIYTQFLLMLCTVFALHIANRILLEADVGEKTRKIAMTVLCLLPNFAFLSVIFRREGVILSILAVSLFFFLRWMHGSSEWCFLLAVVVGFVGSIFHGGEVGIPIGYIFVHMLYSRKMKKFKFSAFSIATSIVIATMVIFLYNNYGDIFFGKINDIENVTDIATISYEGGSSYAAYVGNSDSIFNMIKYTPLRILFYQFSPFIWQIRGISDLIAMCFSSWVFLYVWFITIRYIISGMPKNRNVIIAVFIAVLFTTFIFAWGVSNTGTAIRHREKLVIFNGVLLGLVMDGMQDDRQRKRNAKVYK